MTYPAWRLDSDAPYHITADRKLLVPSLELFEKQEVYVHGPDGEALPILGRGTVNSKRFKIPEVLYVPDLRKNIISKHMLAKHGYEVQVHGTDLCYIIKDVKTGQIAGQGHQYIGMTCYVLDRLHIDQGWNWPEELYLYWFGWIGRFLSWLYLSLGQQIISRFGRRSAHYHQQQRHKSEPSISVEGTSGHSQTEIIRFTPKELRRGHTSSSGATGTYQRKEPTPRHKFDGRPSFVGQQHQNSVSDSKLSRCICALPQVHHDQSQHCTKSILDDSNPTKNYTTGMHLHRNQPYDTPRVLSTSVNEQRAKHFYMDSGAAYHSTYDASVIKSYPAELRINPPIPIIGGFSGPAISVRGCGYIECADGMLDGVLYVPDSAANLVSVGQLTSYYPVRVVFYRDQFWIEEHQNGKRIGEGHREGSGNHYILERFNPGHLLVNNLNDSHDQDGIITASSSKTIFWNG